MEYPPNDGNKTDIETKPGIMELVRGILRDATDIISKEMMAARLEIREEMEKAKSSLMLMGVAAVALMIGSILLAFALVYLLQDLSGLDLWICYAIIGAVISAVGLIILYVGKRRAARTNLVPTGTIENAKEDARWVTRRVKYEAR